MAMSAKNSPLSSQPLYEEISVVGTGAYGTVYKGYDLKTSNIVAMKRIRIQITEEGLPVSTIREIAYLRQLEKYDHKNIVKLLDVINGPRLPSEQSVILIFEFIDYDLNNYIANFSSNLKLEKIYDLMQQMLIGVDFLHTNRIIHRDLKPQNILVTKDGIIKIADFGLARIYSFTTVLTSVVVTLWYRSPEVLLHSTYSSTVDMWSLGCIFAELYLLRPLFMGQSDIDQLYKIFDIMGLPSEQDWPVNSVIPLKSFSTNSNLNKNGDILKKIIPNIDDTGLDLLRNLLNFNMNDRISARNALNHLYFRQFETDSKENSTPVNKLKNCEENGLASLPDITNVFQPNILKRKRIINNSQKS
ncbi:cyclin-dependent kinase 6-like [Brachionus plicatilis]|uniref:cyclin-dependent kinase n=1 Tax=Brachionus plicatilis TaxID=10195 RepID=A0A3M7SCF4_BRAPC|nr:cyclin-dependent kinase 6-like [Brachionus plicatilis]